MYTLLRINEVSVILFLLLNYIAFIFAIFIAGIETLKLVFPPFLSLTT